MNSGHSRPLTSDLPALERRTKCCGYDSTFSFEWIFFKLVENEDRHKISEDFDTRPDQTIRFAGLLGWAMVLGSFQCHGALLLLHIVGQGPAVLDAGAGRVGYIFYIFHLSILSFGRRLNMTEILCFWLLNPNGSCQLLFRTSSLSTG